MWRRSLRGPRPDAADCQPAVKHLIQRLLRINRAWIFALSNPANGSQSVRSKLPPHCCCYRIFHSNRLRNPVADKRPYVLVVYADLVPVLPATQADARFLERRSTTAGSGFCVSTSHRNAPPPARRNWPQKWASPISMKGTTNAHPWSSSSTHPATNFPHGERLCSRPLCGRAGPATLG